MPHKKIPHIRAAHVPTHPFRSNFLFAPKVPTPGKSACASRGIRVIAVIRMPSQQRLTCQRRNRSDGASRPSYCGTMTPPASYSPPADVASAWLLYQPHEDMAQLITRQRKIRPHTAYASAFVSPGCPKATLANPTATNPHTPE